MSARRVIFYFSSVLLLSALAGVPIKSQFSIQTAGGELVADRNVNMVSGTRLPLGDPWLQRQNEPSGAASSRSSMHLLFAANDYRTIDVPDPNEVRGIVGVSAIRDAWIGVFESFNGGESYITMLLPGFPQDTSAEGAASPIHGFDTACDPIVRAGASGRFYLSGIAFNRSQNAGVVFVARYVDLNNREKVEEIIDQPSGLKKYVGPIQYQDTRIVCAGNAGQFIDMPNMTVDVPRTPGAPGNVYLAYTVFLGNSDINARSRVVFVRSTDGGINWSQQIKLTESQHIIQRPVIVIDPKDSTGNTIYVVFRRFAHGTTPGGIVITKSIDGGLSFSKPVDIATLFYPFDQWTKGDGTTTSITSCRTNSYPAMAADENGTLWVVWAARFDQNGQPHPDGQARIMFSCSTDGGLTWWSPQFVDANVDSGNKLRDGHQFMPSITCAGGRKTVIWYDQRDDIALTGHDADKKFIEDVWEGHRHTIDVRAAEAPSASPGFGNSILVSRYLFFMVLDQDGNPYMDGELPRLWQGEFSFVGLPLFWLGTKPFHGDYLEVVSSPQILPPPSNAAASWLFNIDPSEPTTAHAVWTDNRDVWPPGGDLYGDWVHYSPPTSVQDGDFFPQIPCLENTKDATGMRNQNVYTSNLNHGVIVGSPGNTKQLSIPGFQDDKRTFVVSVKNTTEDPKRLALNLFAIGGVDASFEQFSSTPTTSLEVDVAPFSSVSSTVYVNQSGTYNGFAPVRVDVSESSLVVGRVYLNPDTTNNPILDPAGGDLGAERHNPEIGNPRVWKYDVGNPKEPNASFLSPRAQNPRAQNSGYVNPRAQNKNLLNPRAQNPRAQNYDPANPRAQNENIVNNEMYNPRAQNPRAQNTALTDMTWTVTNDGNTTSAYSFDIVSDEADFINNELFATNLLIAQVLVYKMHTVPIDNACELLETHADELIVNVTNPRAQNPRAQNSSPVSGFVGAMGRKTAGQQAVEMPDITFHLAPGEEAEVILRVYDPYLDDPYLFDSYIGNIAGEIAAEAANTGETAPRWDTQDNVPWVMPLPAIVASPISLSFNASGSKTLSLALSGLGPGESLEYSLSDNAYWLTVSSSGGTLSGTPTVLTVTVDATGLNSATGVIVVTVPEAYNNPVRIPVYLNTTASQPSMVVYEGETAIEDGEAYDFGTVGVGETSDVTFTISNAGTADLILGGKPYIMITGADADQFSVQQQPASPVPAGGNTTFVIRFAPTDTGLKNASLSIINNDLEENPYDIALRGTAPLEMSTPRTSHSAARLADGRVLICGGYDTVGGSPLASAEFFDPATGTFAPSSYSMTPARAGALAVELLNGKVLLIGGEGSASNTAEVFDPATGQFEDTPGLNGSRSGAAAVRLQDGRVLVCGGYDAVEGPLASAEVFDPGTPGWTPVGYMKYARRFHTATLLSSGKVLVCGGVTEGGGYLPNGEIYDPAAPVGERFTLLQDTMANGPRARHTATWLPNGVVIICGGRNGDGYLPSTEVFDPTDGDGAFFSGNPMPDPRIGHTATLLPDGRVLICGGYYDIDLMTGHLEIYRDSATLFSPTTFMFTALTPMSIGRRNHTAVLLPDGTVLICGGANAGTVLQSVEIYDPGP